MNIKVLPRFEIHSHSHYSNIRLIDSINRPKDMLITANELGLSGLTISDHECLCGHIDFIKEYKDLKEKRLINDDFTLGLANEIYLTENRNKDEIEKYFHYLLIAKNEDGHAALRELSSKSWINSFYVRGMERVPTLKIELEEIVKKYPNSLISSTACIGGELGYLVNEWIHQETVKLKDIKEIKRRIKNFLDWNKNLFRDDFYLEIAPSDMKDQIEYNKRVILLGESLNIKVVIGTDAHYLTESDRPIHKAYLNSKNGEREVDDFYSSAYLMSQKEIFEYFSHYIEEDKLIEIINNSEEIRQKINFYDLKRNPIIPTEKVTYYEKKTYEKASLYPNINWYFNSDSEQDRYWINTVIRKAKELGYNTKEGLERIEKEADIQRHISEKLGQPLSAYHNTMAHYIDLFWESGSITGPGRGSACGWLTNMLLGITQVDPLKWGLNEWRYLNKSRIELGDIDSDLAPSKRPLIFKKIREQKGQYNLLQICTFGTEGTRSAILTSMRGYRSKEYPNGIDSDIGQYLSGMIPQERGFLWPLEDVINGNEEKDRKPIKKFLEEVEKYPGLLDIMKGLEGLVNKRSQHASGVVLYNDDPWKTNAIMKSPSGDLITQFSLHNAEYVGDTKFDFLVTEISDKIISCIKLLQEEGFFEKDLTLREIYNKYLHPNVINLEDNRIWEALSNGSVIDVFQFNSDVGLQAAKVIKPTNPLEMTAANALMRLMSEKGTERPLDRYVRLKNNIDLWYREMRQYGLSEEEIKLLETYYKADYGTPPYQESVMMVLMDPNISNFTLEEANDARKLIGKKEMKRIPQLKDKFFSQCKSSKLANYVWTTAIMPSLGYGFSVE